MIKELTRSGQSESRNPLQGRKFGPVPLSQPGKEEDEGGVVVVASSLCVRSVIMIWLEERTAENLVSATSTSWVLVFSHLYVVIR